MRLLTVALLASLVVAPGAAAKDPEGVYKTAEAKHFTRVEGVELSPAFSDYLYAELRNELTKTKLFAQVIGEGEAVEDADAANSVVIDQEGQPRDRRDHRIRRGSAQPEAGREPHAAQRPSKPGGDQGANKNFAEME